MFQTLCRKGQTLSICTILRANHLNSPWILSAGSFTTYMTAEAKGCALSCIFSGQVNWRAKSCNRKKPWRHLSPPDEKNSNYSGKSIFNPIFLPYRPTGSLEVEKVTGKFISKILLAALYLLHAFQRGPLFLSTLQLGIITRAEHIQPYYMKIVRVYENWFFFFILSRS